MSLAHRYPPDPPGPTRPSGSTGSTGPTGMAGSKRSATVTDMATKADRAPLADGWAAAKVDWVPTVPARGILQPSGLEVTPGAEPRRIEMAPYNASVGPLTHLVAERTRLRDLSWEHFDAVQLAPTIGAEIHGVDLAGELEQPLIDELWQALLDYKVLFFRDQDLTPGAHVALARRFGNPEVHPFRTAHPEHPELVRFHKGGQRGAYENGWHTDCSWRERPSMGAILHALKVPPAGGDTMFADMSAAYEGLDPGTRERIVGLRAVHDYFRATAERMPRERRRQLRETYPPVEHPVVCRHPDTNRPLLFVNRFYVTHIVGMECDESAALVDRLAAQAEVPEYQCRFQWRDGSVAFWDNRAVQHYALSDYWPDERVLDRVSLAGDRPF